MGLKKCVSCKVRFEWDSTQKCPNCGWDKQQWKNRWKDGVSRTVQDLSSIGAGTPSSVNNLLDDINKFDTRTLQSGFLIVLQDYIENDPTVLPDPILNAFDENVPASHPFHQYQQNTLEELDLPKGFSTRQQPGEYNLLPLADDANQHEWLIFPGEDTLESSAEGLADIICPAREQLIQKSKSTNISPQSIEFAIFQALLMNVFTPTGAIIPAFIAVYLRKSQIDLDDFCP